MKKKSLKNVEKRALRRICAIIWKRTISSVRCRWIRSSMNSWHSTSLVWTQLDIFVEWLSGISLKHLILRLNCKPNSILTLINLPKDSWTSLILTESFKKLKDSTGLQDNSSIVLHCKIITSRISSLRREHLSSLFLSQFTAILNTGKILMPSSLRDGSTNQQSPHSLSFLSTPALEIALVSISLLSKQEFSSASSWEHSPLNWILAMKWSSITVSSSSLFINSELISLSRMPQQSHHEKYDNIF